MKGTLAAVTGVAASGAVVSGVVAGPANAEEMLAGLRSRDPGAERTFYEQHVERVYRLCARMTGRDDLAQECTQDTFVRAFDRIAAFRGDASLSTWLHAIAVSIVLNSLRREKRSAARHAEIEVADQMATTPRDAEPDLKVRMRSAIAALPPGYRAVFVMHDIEGFTHEEIGTALGVAAGTSKTQLFHARRKLREALAPFVGTEAV